MKLKYQNGQATIDIQGSAQAIVLDLVRQSAPIIMRELEKEIAELEANARSKWPTRQKKYGSSKDSKGKFERGIRIFPPSSVQGFVANMAPYAWAIKAGPGSNTPVKRGGRIANVLLWAPAKKGAEKLAQRTAAQMIRSMKRIK